MTPEGQSVLQQIDSFYASRMESVAESESARTLRRVRSDLERIRRERDSLRQQLTDITRQLETARSDLSDARSAPCRPESVTSKKRERDDNRDDLVERSNKRVASTPSKMMPTSSSTSTHLDATPAGPKSLRSAHAVITTPSADSTRHEVALYAYFVQQLPGIVENAEGHLSIQHIKGYMILRPFIKLPTGPKQALYRLVACPGLYSLSVDSQKVAIGSTKQLSPYQGPSQNATVHTVAAWLANRGVTISEVQEACAYAQATIQYHANKPSPTLDWLATAEWVTHWRNAVEANTSSSGSVSLWWKPPKNPTPRQQALRVSRLAKFPILANFSSVNLLPMDYILPPSPLNVKELYLRDATPILSTDPMVTAAVPTILEASTMGTSNTEASVAVENHGSTAGPTSTPAVAEVAPGVDAIMTGVE